MNSSDGPSLKLHSEVDVPEHGAGLVYVKNSVRYRDLYTEIVWQGHIDGVKTLYQIAERGRSSHIDTSTQVLLGRKLVEDGCGRVGVSGW